MKMKKNIRFVLLGELVLFVAIFLLTIMIGGAGLTSIEWFFDSGSLLLIVLVVLLGLLIMGVWKDFAKSFSVGMKQYSLLELKNIIGAIDAAQKLTVFAALFAFFISAILISGVLTDISQIGPKLAMCFLSGLYAVVVEFFLLPLKLNAERKMNEEMDLTNE